MSEKRRTSVAVQSKKGGGPPVEPSMRDAVSDWLELFVKFLGLPDSESGAIRDELEDHLRSRVDDLMITGVDQAEAVRIAVSELGEVALLARGFKEARQRPRRRLIMHAALFMVAGSALVLSSTAFWMGGGSQPIRPSVAVVEGGSLGEIKPETKPGGALGPVESLHKYDVRDLVFAEAPLEQTQEGQMLLRTVTELVYPESWAANGGDDARLFIVGNTLFVDAPSEVQDGVAWVIDSLIADRERLEEERRAEEMEKREAVERAQAESEEHRARVGEQIAAEREARVADLRDMYEQLRERLIEMSRQRVRLEFDQDSIETEIDENGRTDEARDRLAELAAERTRLDLEQDDVQERLIRVRRTLADLEIAAIAE